MTDEERYAQVCQPQFKALIDMHESDKRDQRANHAELKMVIEDIDRKMFKGNGGDPIDVQLVKVKHDVADATKAISDVCEKNDTRWRRLFWAMGLLLTASVPHLINGIIAVFNHVFGKG